jgi:hypothetical protein
VPQSSVPLAQQLMLPWVMPVVASRLLLVRLAQLMPELWAVLPSTALLLVPQEDW